MRLSTILCNKSKSNIINTSKEKKKNTMMKVNILLPKTQRAVYKAVTKFSYQNRPLHLGKRVRLGFK